MATGFCVGLERSYVQCVYCKSTVKDSIRCFSHNNIKNVLCTYIRGFDCIDEITGEGKWTLKQFCHREVFCPKSVQCDQVIQVFFLW